MPPPNEASTMVYVITSYSIHYTKLYEDIEKIDPENDFVERGYGEIADRYAALAEEAHRAFNIEKARVYAARGLEIVPDSYNFV